MRQWHTVLKREIVSPCRRLHRVVVLCWLRLRKAEAEWIAVQLEADMLVAPRQLADLRAHIARLDTRLRALEDQR